MALEFFLDTIPSVAIAGRPGRFPVHRIYCVGRNYEEHKKEFGIVDRDPPFFFAKPADAIVAGGEPVAYPPRTSELHHEIELVIAIGLQGRDIPVQRAAQYVYGYAIGNDLTRRDLQLAARQKGRPWEMGKSFDRSACISSITPAASAGEVSKARIWLKVNDQVRQDANIADMIWTVPEIIAELSSFVELRAGDLIYTGTPAGVGPVIRGDRLEGGIDGLGVLVNTII
jgi:fumarylpyruvate hydrolase